MDLESSAAGGDSPSEVVVVIERVNDEVPSRPAARNRDSSSNNFIGKHRLAAAINQIHLQIQFIQEELEQLETLGESSLVCKEFISSVEASADALLPINRKMDMSLFRNARHSLCRGGPNRKSDSLLWDRTKGPGDAGWDRWFQGTHNSRSRKRWI